MNSSGSVEQLLKLTKLNVDTFGLQVYFNLLEVSSKNILKIIPSIPRGHLWVICYYLIVQKKITTLQRWFWTVNLPQLDVIGWSNALLALQLIRDGAVKCTGTFLGRMLTTLFRAPSLAKLYPEMLQLPHICCKKTGKDSDSDSDDGKDSDSDGNDTDDGSGKAKELEFLRYMLLSHASVLYGACTILNKLWKKIDYDRKAVWDQCIYTHFDIPSSPRQFVTAKPCGCGRNLLLNVCRRGSPSDLRIFMHMPALWENSIIHQHATNHPVSHLIRNACRKTFRLAMDWWYTSNQAANLFGNLAPLIKRDLWINKLFSPKTFQVNSLLKMVNLTHRTYKMKIYCWLTSTIFEDDAYLTNARNTFDFYTDQNPCHARPEQLLLAADHNNFISAKADGQSFRETILPATVYSRPENLKCSFEKLQIQTAHGPKTLYLIFDVVTRGNWKQRISKAREYHCYLNLPENNVKFELLGQENEALQTFVNSVNHDELWWPKGVYEAPAHPANFFSLLSRPPVTIYPNDGWILACSSGTLLKIKPKSQMTADLEVSGRSGIWRCIWQNNGWVPLEQRTDKYSPNQPSIVIDLETFHKYPWNSGQLLSLYKKKIYYNVKNQDRKMSQQIREMKKYIDGEYRAAQTVNWKEPTLNYELGAGFAKHGTMGLDLDYRVVANTDLDWVDARTMRNPVTGEPKLLPYSWSAKYSIHYLAESRESWQVFLRQLANSRKIVIVTHDEEGLFPDHGQTCVYLDESTGRKIRAGWCDGVWEAEYNLKWRSGIHREPLISSKWLIYQIEKHSHLYCSKCKELPMGSKLLIFK